MRSRISLLALFFIVSSIALLPLAAHASAIPFFGPIIPQGDNQSVCPAGWGMVLVVINNIISFSITIAIVFVAPIMIGYAGFLMVVNPTSSGDIQKAKKVLWNTIIGLVISLAGWMIVAAIMAVLYNPTQANGLKAWADIIGSHNAPACLPQKGALPGDTLNQAVTTPGLIPGAVQGKFTFDPGIDAQVITESGALNSLLSCMVAKVPAGVGRISSISDSVIANGSKTFAQCAAGGTAAGCAHEVKSCHYGGRSCIGSSYAVDFGDQQNKQALSAAAMACNSGAFINDEGGHIHISVGMLSNCECN